MHVNLDKEPVSEVRQKCLELAGDDAELMFMDNFDAAIVGIGEVCGNPPAVVYDQQLVIDALMEANGGNYEAAREFYDFNISSAFMGSGMPVMLTRLP